MDRKDVVANLWIERVEAHIESIEIQINLLKQAVEMFK